MNVLGAPIKGTIQWVTELALVFADEAQSEAAKFVLRRRLEGELVKTQQDLESGRRDIEAADASVARAQAELYHQASDDASSKGRHHATLGIAIGVPFWLGLIVGYFNTLLGIALFGIGIGVGLKVTYDLTQRAKRTQVEKLSALKTALDGWIGEAGRLRTETQRLDDRLGQVRQELASIVPQRTIRSIARAYYPLSAMEVAGYPVLVDHSEGAQDVPLKVADLATDPELIREILSALEDAKRVPVLLRPGTKDNSELSSIHGEELRLRRAVERFGEMLDQVPTFDEQLPLVEKTSPLARYVQDNQSSVNALVVPGTLLRSKNDSRVAAACCRLGDVSSRMRQVGRHVADQLTGVREQLSVVFDVYRGLRTDALAGLHDGIEAVVMRADLPYTNMYCPRCNRVPAYLFCRLGIDLETAHELLPDALMQALQGDDEARERLVENETLMQDIGQGWTSVREMSGAIEQLVAAKNAAAAGVGEVIAMRSYDSRLRAMRGQLAQLIQQFQSVLRKAVTGNARPVLELSRAARLYLDPEKQTWTCAVCSTTFDDPAVANMGRLLRVKDELLMPMWNHLWTEKADFRKSELFRTNDQIQDLIEKEVGALRDVSEQYRADMRPVRENLVLATSDALTRREQLETTVNSLVVLGVMTPEAAKGSVERLETLTGGDLASHKRRAEAKETLLNQEPQAQLLRRDPAIDPVDVHLTPEALFRLDASGRERLLLAESAG